MRLKKNERPERLIFFFKYGFGHNSSRGVAKTKCSGVAERNENLRGNSEKEEEVLSKYKWVFVEF